MKKITKRREKLKVKEKVKEKNKKKKLKLMPSLREKRHYVVVMTEEKKGENIKEEKIKEIINNTILDFIGILGYAKAGPIFVETGKIDNVREIKKRFYFIISVTTKYVDKVKAAISLINESSLVFRCIGVSGTIKKSKRFLS